MSENEQLLTTTMALLAGFEAQEAALRSVIHLWAKAKTSESAFRHEDLVRKKQEVVASFFSFVGKNPGEVDALDVERWLERLREQKLKPATVYARVSFLSSFYRWAMRDPQVGAQIRVNPILLARPKAPRPCQTDSTKAWTDEELQAIVAAVENRAAGGEIVGKRDLALLRMYMATGRRREEIISLRGRDVRLIDEGLEVGGRMKSPRIS